MSETLKRLFGKCFGQPAETVSPLGSSGSNRRYYRITGADGTSAVGVEGLNVKENEAFFTIGRHFRDKGINVPELLAISGDGLSYIQEDLGDVLLFDAVAAGRESGEYSPGERALLRRAMSLLPEIQYRGAEGLDFSVCYPEPGFSCRMVMFDLNYFKYCFLKDSGLEFDEMRLQDDFDRLCADLMSCTADTFMYRDFQSRNVMVKDDELYFIDFQGGRRGPVYYDVASFVWQARARYPEDLKEELIGAYLDAAREFVPDLDADDFREKLRLFVLFRTMQVLGAYGFRGYFERKRHFLESVPFAVDNLRSIMRQPFSRYPYLSSLLVDLTGLDRFRSGAPEPEDGRLRVEIISFSYKKGIPEDTSGNGGGYVFDCRAVNNPGRYAFYRQFTGMDSEVISFLEDDGEIKEFLGSVYALADAHVERFLERGFTHLQICFGCTGGQHRSVYSAEHLAAHLKSRYDVGIVLRHRELGITKNL